MKQLKMYFRQRMFAAKIAWSQTGRSEKEQELIASDLEAPSCSSMYGLCEQDNTMKPEHFIWLLLYMAALAGHHRFPEQAADAGVKNFSKRFPGEKTDH